MTSSMPRSDVSGVRARGPSARQATKRAALRPVLDSDPHTLSTGSGRSLDRKLLALL